MAPLMSHMASLYQRLYTRTAEGRHQYSDCLIQSVSCLRVANNEMMLHRLERNVIEFILKEKRRGIDSILLPPSQDQKYSSCMRKSVKFVGVVVFPIYKTTFLAAGKEP